jgi:predicted lipoprotein with Yx(FWY)xxD motif
MPTDLTSNLSTSDFFVIDVFGRKQLAFRGHPLCYFSQDNSVKGVTKGVSVTQPEVWPVHNTTTAALQ